MDAFRRASPVHVLYGSETGNAEEISRTIHAGLAGAGLTPGRLGPMKGYAAAGFAPGGVPATDAAPRPLYVLVTSTTGDGDPPENVRAFLRYLRRKDHAATAMAGVRYALLGLGDTNYENFCAAGKRVDTALRKVGAVRLGDRADADDAVGLEAVVEPFIAGVYGLLADAVAAAAAAAAAAGGAADGAKGAAPAATPNGDAPARAVANGDAPAAAAPVVDPPAVAAGAASVASAAAAAAAGDANGAPPPTGLESEMADLVAAIAAAELTASAASAAVPPLLPPRLAVERLPAGDAPAVVAPPTAVLTPAVEPSTIFTASLTAARRLTDDVPGDAAVKRVWHLVLTPTGEGAAAASAAAYHPGDAFGVVTANREEDVDAVLARLAGDVGGDALVRLAPPPPTPPAGAPPTTVAAAAAVGADAALPAAAAADAPTSVRRLLAERVDLCAPLKKSALRALAEHCGAAAGQRQLLLFLSSRAGKAQYGRMVTDAGRGLPRLLADVAPACRPPLDVVLDVLPPLPPRWYSAASAPAVDGADLAVALSVVTTADGRRGLCSGMLDGLASALVAATAAGGGTDVPRPVVRLVRRSADVDGGAGGGGAPRFRPPADPAVPMIMVGPGTGVAPFRGFLRHRRAQVAAAGPDAPPAGDTWLFFGCRHEARDYLYADELRGFVADGTLTHLDTSFSRDGDPPAPSATGDDPPRAYVQTALRRRGADVAALLLGSDTATVYVCGDGAGMAAGVHAALVEVLAAHGGASVGGEAGATARLAGWARSGRYVRDIWYFGRDGDDA